MPTPRVTDYLVHPICDLLDERTRVLKCGDLFAVFDRRGDATPYHSSSHGIYLDGTRFVSGLSLRLGGKRPLLLSSSVTKNNALLTVDLANPDLHPIDGEYIPADTIHLFRSRFLHETACYDRLRVTNHGMKSISTELTIEMTADFVDIFEVRGATRDQRGDLADGQYTDAQLVYRYHGLDGVRRTTRIECDPEPASVNGSALVYVVSLGPGESLELRITIACLLGSDSGSTITSHDSAYEKGCSRLVTAPGSSCRVSTSSESFNAWIDRSVADLNMMLTHTEHGPYPYAGVPWFSTVFGRDGLITARETLWLNASIARGVLNCLAATQATNASDAQDAEPGKIVHEMRGGEMAALGEIPFGRYYGSIDSTPLFVMLADEYVLHTGDVQTVDDLWPALLRALSWIETSADLDGDGFAEYARHSDRGLVQQGWKDSDDSVFHADGRLAEPPIALCEVQAYIYAARLAGARLARLMGDADHAERLTGQATELEERFAHAFWSESLGSYALALDGSKEPCLVRSSNAGQCLFTGIARPDHADSIMKQLMSDGLFSGWGIRTLASSERRYNPMSYHNGSVWPHDNALIALGMARMGRPDLAAEVLDGLFHAVSFIDMVRMPELFCGFRKREQQGPTLYPVACAPQAWAAGSVFLMLEACLGLAIDGMRRQVRFHRPVMPAALDWIRLDNLHVGPSRVDILLARDDSRVTIDVLDSRGSGEVTVSKSDDGRS